DGIRDFHVTGVQTCALPILIEHAFMTNKEDYRLLKSNDFRRACAEHIARAVCEHLGIRYPESRTAEVRPAVEPGPFKDVPKNDWAAEAIEWAKKEGIILGFDDGTFQPDKPVTRKELAVILYRTLKK